MNPNDKRVIKTKKNLKSTVIKILLTTPFEKMTVSEICREGQTSRITFYTYYEDKYSLVEEMFKDYTQEAVADYRRLQETNNKSKNAVQGYFNMLECILNLCCNNKDVLSSIFSDDNTYLQTCFYRYTFENVADYVENHKQQMTPKYTSIETAALIYNGLWGVIKECIKSGMHLEELKNDVMGIYKDILESNIFIKH